MTPIVDAEIERYAEDHTSPEPDWLVALADETERSTSSPGMMVGRLEGRFLKMLVHLAQARRVLEIGTFTGYSALSMAEALPPGGLVITCDVNPDHVAIARRHIAASPYADRIDVRLGPALETIDTLDGEFDLVFIDADKTNYGNYLDVTLPLLSAHGVVAVDNVLWSGRLLDKDDTSPDTVALRAFNARVKNDPGLEAVMLPVRDGVTLIRRVP